MKVNMDKSLFQGQLLVMDNSDEIFDYKSYARRNKDRDSSVDTSDSTSVQDFSGKLRFFATDTVSGKMINQRVYSNDSIKKCVRDSGWTSPHKRRIIKNHNSYGDYQVLGMINDSYYVDFKGDEHFSSDATKQLPLSVKNFIIQDNKVGDGAGVVELVPNQRFIDGLFNSENTLFSQSSAYDKALCSICGKDLFGQDCCDHWPGRKYPVAVANTDQFTNELCYPILVGDRKPFEYSSVVTPANDTSILYILDVASGECYKADDISDFASFFEKYSITCNNDSIQVQNDSSISQVQSSDSFVNEYEKYKKIGSSDSELTPEQPKGVKMLTDKQKDLLRRSLKLAVTDAKQQSVLLEKIEPVLANPTANEDTMALVMDLIELSKASDVSVEATSEVETPAEDSQEETPSTDVLPTTDSDDKTKEEIKNLQDSVNKILNIIQKETPEPTVDTPPVSSDSTPPVAQKPVNNFFNFN